MSSTNPSASGRPLALVTGASAGIGAEFARQLAAGGHDLVLTARRRERLEQLGAELEGKHGCQCLVVVADLADPAAAETICRQVEDAGRQVDLLVNNAGYGVAGLYHATDWASQQQFLQVMVNAVAELTHRLLPGMRTHGRGGVINVASLAGVVPGAPGHTLYGAVKAWMISFTEALALENAESGLSFQALCPGFTYSEFHDVVGTRDLVSNIPGFMWMNADRVVAISLAQFGRRNSPVMLLPGAWNRFAAMLARKLPYRMSMALIKRQSRQFRRGASD
ncbi:MAG: SDR family NAD(P)-dependent oxidoreductase [Wenzhouxiangellaceae bacterium]